MTRKKRSRNEMENITLGQFGTAIGFVVALISGVAFISAKTKSWIQIAMKDQMTDIDKRFDGIDAKIEAVSRSLKGVDLESCKNFLVQFLSEVESGKPIDDFGKARFWEQYEHYQKAGGNSYIKRKVEELTEKKWL